MSTTFDAGSKPSPHTSSRSWSRDSTWPGVAHQVLEQRELGAGQLDRAAVDPHLARAGVELQRPGLDHLRRRLAAPAQRPQPRRQLAQRERLHQVVVRARVEAADPVGTPCCAPSASGSARRCPPTAAAGTGRPRSAGAAAGRARSRRGRSSRAARRPSSPSNADVTSNPFDSSDLVMMRTSGWSSSTTSTRMPQSLDRSD